MYFPQIGLTDSCRESSAIMLYLVEMYDKERRISVSEGNEKYQQLQWLFFQASGQGFVGALWPA